MPRRLYTAALVGSERDGGALGHGVRTTPRAFAGGGRFAFLAWLACALAFACAEDQPSAPPPAAALEPAPAPESGSDAASGTIAPNAPQPGREPGGDVIVLPCDELFVEGSAELTEEGRARLRALAADILARGPELVVVRAHTDDDGSVAFNYALSDDRAEAARVELVAGGLDPARIRARGLGPKYPIAPNDTPEGRARNRRVTVEVRAPSWQPSGASP